MWNPFKKKQTNVIEYNSEMQQADSYLGVVLNAVKTISRRLGGGGLFGISPDGKRDYNTLFGYGTFLDYADYLAMYKRGGIANTVVAKVAKSCWRDMPEIKDNDKNILEEQLLKLKKVKFFKAMERADILNRVGNFSVMLIGIPDGLQLDQPVGLVKKDSFSSMYFNVYSYDGIEIIQFDNDPASPRFGLPVLYQLQTIDTDGSQRKQKQMISVIVHYTRIVHLAEGQLDSTIEGTPALEAPWNALIDKNKVRGSSAEAYYRNSRQKLALEAAGESKVDTTPEARKILKENVENFQDGFEDVLRLNNMKANMLQPSMASPRDPFDIAVEEISGTTGIPVRILTGKGGGTLIGSEDKATWNALVKDRQDQECTIYLLDALAIMAGAGIIELPEDAEVEWPVQPSLNEKEASESTKNKAEAFKAVTEGLTNIGGDEVAAKSAFKEVGLEGIEIDDIDLSQGDDNLDKNI
jgi:hypothetical protein